MTQHLKAPYNFVPVSKSIVFPEWSNAVSHDIPFDDGESGTIKVKITAENPIFVKNGMSKSEEKTFKNDKEDEQILPYPFSQYQNKYFIPGSSIKGAIRNVLEIMTFSKMNAQNDRYSVRDFQNKSLYQIPEISKHSQAGWLSFANGIYTLEDCGAAGRISHKEIDRSFKTDFRSFFLKGGGFRGSNPEHKSASFKYKKFGNNSPENAFEQVYLEEDNPVDLRKFFKISENSNLKGTIVFTGQAGPRNEQKGKKANGKLYEFVFFEPKSTITINEKDKNDTNKEVIKNFKFAMFEHERSSWSIDWTERRKQLINGDKIPVFFRKDSRGNIIDMGLSYLYKITYKNSVHDLLSKDHKEKRKLDFAETIFGYIGKEEGLKGRIHFSHAFNTNNAQPLSEKSDVLSSPKASYYPMYMRQDIKNGKVKDYKTFMNSDAELSGWKKYPVHKQGVKDNPSDAKKIITKYIPLDKGTEFELIIRFHNLRKVELGALLSALTLHDTENCFHSLGMAKPLGYGKTKFEVELTEELKYSKIEYLKYFEAYMSASIKPDWIDSEQVVELITMSSEHENAKLEYMKMNKGGDNEFVLAKKHNEALDKYSKLVEGANKVKSLITNSDIAAAQKAKSAEAKIYAKGSNINELIDAEISRNKKSVDAEIDIRKNDIIEKVEELLRKLSEKNRVIKKRKKDIEIEHRQEKNRIELEKQKKNLLKEGLNIPNDLDDFNKEKKIIEEFYKANEQKNIEGDNAETLKTFIKRCIEKSDKRWTKFGKQDWKLVEKWVGKETAKKWFNEITGK